MLAQRLPSIMPALSFEEALELTTLYSICGLVKNRKTLEEKANGEYTNTGICNGSLMLQRPFRSPHHSASAKGLVGGGNNPKPGEISLSHMGILFLDELAEFPRQHLDLLRQPLETNSITISRANQTLTFPANFLLVGACNPCPCGYSTDPIRQCICSPYQAIRYWSRLSGPFLDRLDLHVDVPRLNEAELGEGNFGEDNLAQSLPESSQTIRLRVQRAIECQRERLLEEKFVYNGNLSHKQIKRHCQIDARSHEFLVRAVCRLGLSARSYDRLLRVARTIADLEASKDISHQHVAEALKYRLTNEPQPVRRIQHAKV